MGNLLTLLFAPVAFCLLLGATACQIMFHWKVEPTRQRGLALIGFFASLCGLYLVAAFKLEPFWQWTNRFTLILSLVAFIYYTICLLIEKAKETDDAYPESHPAPVVIHVEPEQVPKLHTLAELADSDNQAVADHTVALDATAQPAEETQ